jgi:uncharacterized protein (TIGR00369 family)
MRKIINPYTRSENYNCFGCAPHNPHGLQMEFHEDGDEVVCVWEPKQHFQGYGNILHGGIQATLMDEIASWLVFIKLKTAGVTSKIELKFNKPVHTDQGKITLRSRLQEMKKNIALVQTRLFDSTGVQCSESVIYYFTYPQETAREKLRFPDYEEFFEKE